MPFYGMPLLLFLLYLSLTLFFQEKRSSGPGASRAHVYPMSTQLNPLRRKGSRVFLRPVSVHLSTAMSTRRDFLLNPFP